MLTTLALAVALSLSLGQSEQLTITNVRATYGTRLGPVRADNKVLPGDTFVIAFDVNGLKMDKKGTFLYTMSMQVTNDKGKLVYGSGPQDIEMPNYLGGSTLPAFGYFIAGTNPPGEYTLKETIVDRATNAKATLTRKFEILPKALGIVGLNSSYDPDNRIAAPPGGVTGQSIWVHFSVLGFERDSKKKQPDVNVEVRFLDENKKSTILNPVSYRVNTGVDQKDDLLPADLRLALNRPGKFTVEIHATDKIANKEVTLSFPVTVTEQKGTDGADTAK